VLKITKDSSLYFKKSFFYWLSKEGGLNDKFSICALIFFPVWSIEIIDFLLLYSYNKSFFVLSRGRSFIRPDYSERTLYPIHCKLAAWNRVLETERKMICCTYKSKKSTISVDQIGEKRQSVNCNLLYGPHFWRVNKTKSFCYIDFGDI